MQGPDHASTKQNKGHVGVKSCQMEHERAQAQERQGRPNGSPRYAKDFPKLSQKSAGPSKRGHQEAGDLLEPVHLFLRLQWNHVTALIS